MERFCFQPLGQRLVKMRVGILLTKSSRILFFIFLPLRTEHTIQILNKKRKIWIDL